VGKLDSKAVGTEKKRERTWLGSFSSFTPSFCVADLNACMKSSIRERASLRCHPSMSCWARILRVGSSVEDGEVRLVLICILLATRARRREAGSKRSSGGESSSGEKGREGRLSPKDVELQFEARSEVRGRDSGVCLPLRSLRREQGGWKEKVAVHPSTITTPLLLLAASVATAEDTEK
jgi:hypothetical protein